MGRLLLQRLRPEVVQQRRRQDATCCAEGDGMELVIVS